MTEKTLEERLQRVEDFQQIQNIMGRYAYYVMASKQEEINDELMAKNDPGTKVTWGTLGYWEGADAPERALAALRSHGIEDRRGKMALHLPICPVIEVAGDGKTAKGVWISPGLLAMKNDETGELRGIWEWDKYGVDFIKQDGKWKIWHHHIYSLLHWDVDEGWKAAYEKPIFEGGGFKIDTMDGGPYENNPYSPDTVQELLPKPPEPYETWEDTFSY